MKQEGREETGMKTEEKVDCRVFEDQMDALMRGELPEEGMRHLLLHAEGCGACAMQLKVQRTLTGPSLESLEGRVPEALLASVWKGVESGVRPSRPTSPGWFVPALAAAALALLFSTGFLVRENQRLSEEGLLLTQQLTEQQQSVAGSRTGDAADPVARTAALAGRSPFARALSREEYITISGLRVLLERMPGRRTVLSQAQLDAVLRSRVGLSTPLFRDLLAGIDTRNGLRAEDLIRALDALEVGPDFTVPTADLMEILS